MKKKLTKEEKVLNRKANAAYDNCKYRVKHALTYKGTTICDKWLSSRSEFTEWYKKHCNGDWQIDKDILGNGKHYSPETCLFVPPEVNMLFRDSHSETGYKGVYPAGNGEFYARIRINGKLVTIDRYPTREEAHKQYLIKRAVVLHELSVKYSYSPALSQALKDAANKLGV